MKKNGFISEFKAFITKGNVVDMAVGVVVGGAFSKIVSSLVADIITPLISLLTGASSFSELKVVLKEAVVETVDGVETIITPATTLNYGNFIQFIIDFLIISFSIFCVIKAMAGARKKFEKPADPEKLAAEAAAKAEAEAKAAAEAEEIVAARRAQKETADLLREIKELIKK